MVKLARTTIVIALILAIRPAPAVAQGFQTGNDVMNNCLSANPLPMPIL